MIYLSSNNLLIHL